MIEEKHKCMKEQTYEWAFYLYNSRWSISKEEVRVNSQCNQYAYNARGGRYT